MTITTSYKCVLYANDVCNMYSEWNTKDPQKRKHKTKHNKIHLHKLSPQQFWIVYICFVRISSQSIRSFIHSPCLMPGQYPFSLSFALPLWFIHFITFLPFSSILILSLSSSFLFALSPVYAPYSRLWYVFFFLFNALSLALSISRRTKKLCMTSWNCSINFGSKNSERLLCMRDAASVIYIKGNVCVKTIHRMSVFGLENNILRLKIAHITTNHHAYEKW